MDLQTEIPGIVLRELQIEDADILYSLIQSNSKHLMQRGDYTELVESTRTDLQVQLSALAAAIQQFGVFFRDTLIGTVTLIRYQPTIYGLGYWISAEHASRGYMTESVRTIIHYAINVYNAEEFWAGITPSNSPSIKLVARLGFELARTQDTHLSYRLSTTNKGAGT